MRRIVRAVLFGFEGALRALAELTPAPGDALFVGDSRADVLAARAARPLGVAARRRRRLD